MAWSGEPMTTPPRSKITARKRIAESREMAAAVDADRLAGDEVRLDQEQHRLRHLLPATPAGARGGPVRPAASSSGEVSGGASIGPGATAFTRMSGASSSARASVTAVTAAF